eukprot:TRINITY_DN54521_c0_g1_i1.p1 TRINITY_DN54521_c0_g1~~TRINITY_DN54521_c0_g1_i1.p1  ORF type:complete len:349 (+),score=115.54 TRINITY_DN54521_c0_g1_i1:87-1133(+)
MSGRTSSPKRNSILIGDEKAAEGKKSKKLEGRTSNAPIPPVVSPTADEKYVDESTQQNLCVYSVFLQEGINLIAADIGGSSDPYCTITVAGLQRKSKTIKKTLNPKWDQVFVFYSDTPEKILFNVFDWDLGGNDDNLGDCEIDSAPYFTMKDVSGHGVVYENTLSLRNVPKGWIKVKIVFRRLFPLVTEKKLHRAEADLKMVVESRGGKGKAVVVTSSQLREYETLKLKVGVQEKELRDLQEKHEQKRKEVDSLNQSISHAMAANLAAQNSAPGDAKRELSQALTKIAFLEGENSSLKSQKMLLEGELDNFRGHGHVQSGERLKSFSSDRVKTVDANCVVCGQPCTIL